MSDAVDTAVKFETMLERAARAIQERLAPKGSLGLDPHLDQRRLDYLIPDEAFNEQPVYDRVFVAQLNDGPDDGKFVEGGLIIKPQTVEARDKGESPRGIVVSAGMIALDNLMSHGIRLGDVVTFTEVAPWKLPLGRLGDAENSVEYDLLQLRSGDITGSPDVARRMRDGEIRVERRHNETRKCWEHVLVDSNGDTWNPIEPFSGGDY